MSKALIKHASVPAEPAKRQHRRLHRRDPDPLPRERRGLVRVVGGQPLPRVHGGADGVRDARPVAGGRGDLPDALRRRAASTDAPYGIPECRGVVWRYAQTLARANMPRIHAFIPVCLAVFRPSGKPCLSAKTCVRVGTAWSGANSFSSCVQRDIKALAPAEGENPSTACPATSTIQRGFGAHTPPCRACFPGCPPLFRRP